MGSGKSTVGALLARELGWRFVDLDSVVEARAGRSIPELFREEGEDAFREIEARVTGEFLEEQEVVLASGGGWPCRAGRMESLGEETLSIWLRVSAGEVWERVGRGPGTRPLLDVPRPRERIDELLAARELFYGKASWWVETGNRRPEEIVRLVMDRLATDPERPLRA
jgi:shikimate kinase